MNKFMKIAKELSEENLQTNVGGPFGACVVKNGKVIGKGSNHVLSDNDPTAHAEMMAIRDACKNMGSYDLSGCELYTSCFPCPMCLSAIIWSNIKKVYYGNTKEDVANIGFRDDYIYNYIEKMQNDSTDALLELKNMDREETIKTFNEFVKKQDKTKNDEWKSHNDIKEEHEQINEWGEEKNIEAEVAENESKIEG